MPEIAEPGLAPPAPPWVGLPTSEPPAGCLSFYYSDEPSRLPVRAVTRPGDNKSDPNLETGTYGLFSTCERQMRSSVVKRGLRYVFFVSRKDEGRVLTGYYRIAWYCDGVFAGDKADYALAANEMRFVVPIRLDELPPLVRGVATSRWRTWRLLDPDRTACLRDLVDSSPDITSEYLAEIDRLERFNQFHTGARCWNRDEPFSWEAARELLAPDPSRYYGTARSLSNSSPSDHWRCESCSGLVQNRSLLKVCPECGALASLHPLSRDELERRSTA